MNYNLLTFLSIYHFIVFDKILYITDWNAPDNAKKSPWITDTQNILLVNSSSDILVYLGIKNLNVDSPVTH